MAEFNARINFRKKPVTYTNDDETELHKDKVSVFGNAVDYGPQDIIHT